MDNRLKSAVATVLIQGAVSYAVITGLATAIPRQAHDRLNVVDAPPERLPPAQRPPPSAREGPSVHSAAAPTFIQPGADWATASPLRRDMAFRQIHKWMQDNLSDEDRRFAKWRADLPQGAGPAEVTRLRPANLTTHTLYWPAKWSKGPLPIIAWGNGKCSNNSLPYAAFLSEIASHGYFVVAVGNDDIDYPQPEGLEILADGRPLRTQASALTGAVDWAIAENSRAGSPYAGKLDAGRIAYMGHACGGQQAMTASSDPRTATTVLLNTAARLTPEPSKDHKASIALFEGGRDDGDVLEAGDANFARAKAANWPMYKAALDGMSHDGAYPGPAPRWSAAVLAWLDWQLKGDDHAAMKLGNLSHEGWSRIDATGIAVKPAP